MRSNEPIAGNPWPHDMVISIEEHDSALLRMLFVREAWRLNTNGVPRVTDDIDIGTSVRPDTIDLAEADAQWRLDWRATWQRYDEHDRRVHPPSVHERQHLDSLSDEDLLEQFSWVPSSYWQVGVDDRAFTRWRDALVARSELLRHSPLNEHPERRSLRALIGAWRSGLTNIVQLPYDGYFAHRLSPGCLVVSEATRFAPALYDRALWVPPPGAPSMAGAAAR